jgi:hypothetical protein
MAKFIKFPIQKSDAAQPVGPTYDVLVDVSNIAEIEATGATGQNAKTLVVHFIQGPTGAVKVTFTVHTGLDGTGDPTITDGNANPIYDAAVRALTANPGGVVSRVNLGKDNAATPLQMYFSSATYA